MDKLVSLKLTGNLETQGFNIILEIGKEAAQPDQTIDGYLPPAPDLSQQLMTWQEKYRCLGVGTRIKPQRIVYDGFIQKRIEECTESAQKLSTAFNNWLAVDAFRKIDRKIREDLTPDEAIRIVLCTDDPQLQKLPWQLWDFLESYPKAEIAFSKLNSAKVAVNSSTQKKSKIKILAILGHKEGIDTEKDRQLLKQLDADIHFLEEPESHEISDHLWEQAWDIIFFAGHSMTIGETGRIYINPKESLTIDDLWYALRKAVDQGLKLAIFNSCEGTGLAEKLNDLNIPQMIIMREMVPDAVAHEFLKSFLAAFAKGQSLYLSVREAREKLQKFEKQFPCASWLPVIYQNPLETPPTWKSLNKKYRHKFRLYRQSLKISFTIGISSIASLYFLLINLPEITIFINDLGNEQAAKNDIQKAEIFYQIARTINPQSPLAYYNIGYLCDTIFDDEKCAIDNYKKAAVRGLPEAYAELSRISIAKLQDYDAALKLSQQCLAFSSPPLLPPVEAACLKNRAWIRLEQERLDEAEADVRRAIALVEESPHSYCILAQIMKKGGQNQAANTAWQKTLQYAESNVIEQDKCIDLANRAVTP